VRQPGALDDPRTRFGADQLMVERLDVIEPGEVQRVVDEAFERAGRIDVVLNNAGYGLCAAIEEPTRGWRRS
jgi:NAD(P)-dependent dehydrogenase (short-subunit alcohol dehydrogenase family)